MAMMYRKILKAGAAVPMLIAGICAAAIAAQERASEPSPDRDYSACPAHTAPEFFDAFIRSDAVRSRYSAPTVSVVEENIADDGTGRETVVETTVDMPLSQYSGFPIRMEDYYRKRSGDSGRIVPDVHVAIEFRETPGGGFEVEWSDVVYRGGSQGGDDLGIPYRIDGTPYDANDEFGAIDGTLSFARARDCWRLVEDRRYIRGGAR